MGQVWRDILTAFVMGAVLPAVILRLGVLVMQPDVESEPVAEVIATEPREYREILFRDDAGNLSTMELEEYLVGAILAEMPASFEEEALKAQAVAARTYAARAYETGGKHLDHSVCGSYACCQAYMDPADYLLRGGTQISVDKIRAAVLATAGEVLTYEGELIEATYFSCSGGLTEDAVAVWGVDVPYLQSVQSPGEEEASVYQDSKSFSAQEFRQALGRTLPGSPDTWFGSLTHTPGQGVDTLQICGEAWSGKTLRTLLGLRSTMFTVETEGDSIVFHTRGYGHRVGMSQYGADAMAAAGQDYRQILMHYYQGTSIEKWRN